MKPPKACIFDLDGVIVHTAQFHYKAWKALADSLSIPFGKEQNERLKGVSREDSLKFILELGNKELSSEEFHRLMDQKNEQYLSYVSQLDQGDVPAGVLSFMKALTFSKIKLAIGSSSKNAQRIIKLLELESWFEAIIDGTKIEQTKPHPEVFLKAAAALNVPPEECVVFEDAASGIEAAHRAEMPAVGVGDSKVLGQAEVVINTFKGLQPKQLWAELAAAKIS